MDVIIPPLACSPSLFQNVPPRISQWSDQIVAATNKWSLDLYFICAIMDRESLGGDALKPKGPRGTGDWSPRRGHMPPDGLGYGRGLMQIDYDANTEWCNQRDAATGLYLWEIASSNIDKGCEIFARALMALDGDYIAATAGYNAGESRAKRIIVALPAGTSIDDKVAALNTITTISDGKPYVSDVINRRNTFAGV